MWRHGWDLGSLMISSIFRRFRLSDEHHFLQTASNFPRASLPCTDRFRETYSRYTSACKSDFRLVSLRTIIIHGSLLHPCIVYELNFSSFQHEVFSPERASSLLIITCRSSCAYGRHHLNSGYSYEYATLSCERSDAWLAFPLRASSICLCFIVVGFELNVRIYNPSFLWKGRRGASSRFD